MFNRFYVDTVCPKSFLEKFGFLSSLYVADNEEKTVFINMIFDSNKFPIDLRYIDNFVMVFKRRYPVVKMDNELITIRVPYSVKITLDSVFTIGC